MASIIERKRADGTKTYTVQIVRKKGGVILHREAETFLTKSAAERWGNRREAALDQPDGIEAARSPNPVFGEVITRFLAENKRPYGETQTALYTYLKTCELAEMLCSDIRAPEIVAFGRRLREEGRAKVTVAGYISALGTIIQLAKPAWGFRIDAKQYDEALVAMRNLEIIGKGNSRDRRPTLDELDRMMAYFLDRSIKRHGRGVAPMHRIVPFAIFSTRRLDEIVRQERTDVNFANNEAVVRDMKNPDQKIGNHVRVELTPEASLIAQAIKTNDSRLFPYGYYQVQDAFEIACDKLAIHDLHFHDLRHEGISRLFEMGRTIPQVAAVSGHKSWQSLQRYTHLRQSGDKFEGWKWLSVATEPQSFQIQP